jgi:hypothetical protein
MIEKKTSTKSRHDPDIGVTCGVIGCRTSDAVSPGVLDGWRRCDTSGAAAATGRRELAQEAQELLVAVPAQARLGDLAATSSARPAASPSRLSYPS